VAAEDTQFGLPEVTLGYIPSAGGTQTLPRTIPPGAAADLILTGEPVGTAEALRWGLITRVAPAAELDAAVEAAVVELLAGSFAPRRPRL
ncbi:MAG: enoyl-CoA hydratase/isomerase family protein, partial [Dehalococcoidia bacterium]|nr:enoyl-CoA hydratase/isomerase family protein [Dehalococcoidia bacterium]